MEWWFDGILTVYDSPRLDNLFLLLNKLFFFILNKILETELRFAIYNLFSSLLVTTYEYYIIEVKQFIVYYSSLQNNEEKLIKFLF